VFTKSLHWTLSWARWIQSSSCQILTWFVPYFTTQSTSELHGVKWRGDWWIGKELEGSGRNLTQVLSWHLPGETEENRTKLRTGQPVSWLRFETKTFRMWVLVLSAYYCLIESPVFPECSKFVATGKDIAPAQKAFSGQAVRSTLRFLWGTNRTHKLLRRVNLVLVAT
jgi:hypothetical protein